MNYIGQNQYQANWYDDPENPYQLRYFDGVQWTQNFAPKHGTQSHSSNSNGLSALNIGMSIFRNVIAGFIFLIGLVTVFAEGSYLLGISFFFVGIIFSLLILPINFKYKKHLDAGGNYAGWFIESFKYWYTYVFVVLVLVAVSIGSILLIVLSPSSEPDSGAMFIAFAFFFPGTIWSIEILAKIFDLPLGYGK